MTARRSGERSAWLRAQAGILVAEPPYQAFRPPAGRSSRVLEGVVVAVLWRAGSASNGAPRSTVTRTVRKTALSLGGLVTCVATAVGCIADDSRPRARAAEDLTVHPGGTVVAEPCTRQQRAPEPRDEPLVLVESDSFPCRLIAEPTVRLSASQDGSRPDPGGFRVARDRAGRMLTPADSRSARGTVLVWDSAGSYIGRFGSPGDGPGELAPNFAPSIYIGLGDSIYVDEVRRWSLFDSDLRFVRILRASQIGVSGAAIVVPTDAGRFLSAGA